MSYSHIPGIGAVSSGGVTAGFETVHLGGGDISVATKQAASFELNRSCYGSCGESHENGKLEELHGEDLNWSWWIFGFVVC